MLVVISNCTAEMPPIMAAEKSRHEVEGRAKASATFKKNVAAMAGGHEDHTPPKGGNE